MTPTDIVLIIVAIIGSSGFSSAVAWFLSQRAIRQAAKDAKKAQADQLLAQQFQRDAAEHVLEAAKLLVNSGAVTKASLDHITEVTEQTQAKGEETHAIVNHERTLMKKLIATLRRQIASDNPNDDLAQLEAQQATTEASEAE
jgi:hypothetical protein